MTPDFKIILQEIVDRSGWQSGNSLSLIFTGSGRRVAESFNGDSDGAPLLHIEYSISQPVPLTTGQSLQAESSTATGSSDTSETQSASSILPDQQLNLTNVTVSNKERVKSNPVQSSDDFASSDLDFLQDEELPTNSQVDVTEMEWLVLQELFVSEIGDILKS